MKKVRLRSRIPNKDLRTFFHWLERYAYQIPSSLEEVLRKYEGKRNFEIDESAIGHSPIPSGTYHMVTRLPYPLKIEVTNKRKSIYIQIAPALVNEVWPERAENLTLQALDNQTSFHNLPYTLVDHIENGEEKLQVIGEKGFGKTFCCLKAARELVLKTETLPILTGFYTYSNLYVINPLRYGNEKEFGERYEMIRKIAKANSIEEIVEKTKEISKNIGIALMVDDVHYMFDAVRNGKMKLNKLCEILEKVSNLSNVSKVLITDNPLCIYDEEFKNKKLHSILLDFGEWGYEEQKEAILSGNYKILEKSALTRLWVEGIGKYEIASLANVFGVDFSKKYYSYTTTLLSCIANNNPRRAIIFLRELRSYLEKEKNYPLDRVIEVKPYELFDFSLLKLERKIDPESLILIKNSINKIKKELTEYQHESLEVEEEITNLFKQYPLSKLMFG